LAPTAEDPKLIVGGRLGWVIGDGREQRGWIIYGRDDADNVIVDGRARC
jgi:hypothetical protein